MLYCRGVTHPPKPTVTIRLERPTIVALKALATKRQITPSDFIREAIREKIVREAA